MFLNFAIHVKSIAVIIFRAIIRLLLVYRHSFYLEIWFWCLRIVILRFILRLFSRIYFFNSVLISSYPITSFKWRPCPWHITLTSISLDWKHIFLHFLLDKLIIDSILKTVCFLIALKFNAALSYSFVRLVYLVLNNKLF